MSQSGKPTKMDPETLALHAEPRPVVRFKRGLLISLAAMGCLAIFGAAWFALREQTLGQPLPGDQTATINRKPAPDQINALPASYDKIKLGPKLPGDFGVAVAEHQQRPGLSSTGGAEGADAMQHAEEARHALQSAVMFQVSRQANTTAIPSAPGTGQTQNPLSATDDHGLVLDPDRDPNNQGHKLEFVGQTTGDDIYNPHALQRPLSPYEILAGTIIPASLLTGLNSDLPGLVIAQVTQNVFDTVRGSILLIPQGARLIGTYDSVVAFGQSRALLVWQRIVMPNGTSIQIDNLPATDAQGYAGLEDDVDYHTWALLKGIALSTVLGVGSQTTFGGNQSNLVEAIRESTQESTSQAGQRLVEKNLQIQPTITIRPGWPLNVVVHKDLVLKPYKDTPP